MRLVDEYFGAHEIFLPPAWSRSSSLVERTVLCQGYRPPKRCGGARKWMSANSEYGVSSYSRCCRRSCAWSGGWRRTARGDRSMLLWGALENHPDAVVRAGLGGAGGAAGAAGQPRAGRALQVSVGRGGGAEVAAGGWGRLGGVRVAVPAGNWDFTSQGILVGTRGGRNRSSTADLSSVHCGQIDGNRDI